MKFLSMAAVCVAMVVGGCGSGDEVAPDEDVVRESTDDVAPHEAGVREGTDEATPDELLLEPGDFVALEVANHDMPPIRLRVMDNGMVILPYVGELKAEGMKPTELARRFREEALLQRGLDLDATIKIDMRAADQRHLQKGDKSRVFNF